MSSRNSCTVTRDGYRLVWTGRRSSFDCDVYDAASGDLLAELEYPRRGDIQLATTAAELFTTEAIAITRRQQGRQ